mmetsp:Transcript_23669/g.30333  ORF Transcript_23669/g.30333 Transcript_23669/m.30333 type:complete len:224 (-) Transcript_23669:21-692(-)
MRRTINKRWPRLGQHLQELRIGLRPLIYDCVCIREADLWQLAFHPQKIHRAGGRQQLVVGHIFPPVAEILRGERMPIRPLVPRAQVHGEFLVVLILKALENVRDQLIAFVEPHQTRIAVNHHLAHVFGARDHGAQGAALLPQLAVAQLQIDGFGCFRQTLRHRGQAACIHISLPERALLVFGLCRAQAEYGKSRRKDRGFKHGHAPYVRGRSRSAEGRPRRQI